ncbi:patatin family protein [Corynebacterium sp.]|uniref:patatin-like phospholipase family protein n=1 Tax=Corynebacterium sp. TaxID=1720 RepID=UPI002A910DEA|nr:patatin family protein [Corynebacterium sp.]MDY5785522.1 patatin family protein [Corynebacterium sp.]
MIDTRETAVIFEGGGMRNSYTAAAVVTLIEEGVQFGWVGGVSAGSSHTVNYLSGDAWRAKQCFVDFANNPSFGGVSSLLRGTGYFNAEFIYENSGEDLPFDYDAFRANPAAMNLSATRADTGEPVYFTREDIRVEKDVNTFVRASSTLPLIMPTVLIDDIPYVDGALGEHGGISINQAEAAGYEKFLFIGTKPRDYVRPEVSRPSVVRRLFRRTPAVAEAMIARPGRYNASKQRLLDLEAQGRAQLFFPDAMGVSSTERNVAKLRANFAAGEKQVAAEWPAWEEFLAG